MNKKEIETKLDEVLIKFCVDTKYWYNVISDFRLKLEFLFDLNRYNKLLKSLFLSNDEKEFKSYIFEVFFAYDFESKLHSLIYESKQSPDKNTSVDFCYKTNDKKEIHFELRLINQRNKITQDINSQLRGNDFYDIHLNGEDEKVEIVRLQNLILSKCQNKNGKPIKFSQVKNGRYNFIVVYVSELILNMFDKDDCMLAMYGDNGVSSVFRRKIFGLCQQLPSNSSQQTIEYYNKFEHFRKTIHGVLFIKDKKKNKTCYIDLNLEYYLIGNNNLIEKMNGVL